MNRPLLTPLGAARVQLDAQATEGFPLEWAELARAVDLGEETLHLAWELSRFVNLEREEERLGLLLLLFFVFDAVAEGSTQLPIGPAERAALRTRAQRLGISRPILRHVETVADAILEEKGDLTRAQLQMLFDAKTERFASILGSSGERKPIIYERQSLSPQKWHALEIRLAQALLSRSAPPLDASAALYDVFINPLVEPRGPLLLTDEQRAAVELALRAPVVVITGGPGTGKTSIVVSILRAIARLPVPHSVALAAPTGKAADRIAQSIARALARCTLPADLALRDRLSPPRTLHRLLGYSPSEDTFRHHATSPLGEDFVLVDEASMLDLGLMERLVVALRPGARLVLLGDADQLPSVEAGAVLANLVASRGGQSSIEVARLTKSHRMDANDPAGSHILSIATAIHSGATFSFIPHESPSPAAIRLVRQLPEQSLPGVSLFETDDYESFFVWWYQRMVQRKLETNFDLEDPDDILRVHALFDQLDATRLLCATRGRITGADSINAWMGARFAREHRRAATSSVLVGEPVMVVRNDYERNLFNGDQGLILWAGHRTASGEPRPALVVRRGRELSAHRLDMVRSLIERAYATTVHKAQGSEHGTVAIIMPEVDLPRLWTREILYTALTRARTSVWLVGDRLRIGEAVRRPSSRLTRLPERLAAD